MPKKGSPKRGRGGRSAAAGAYSDILAELDEESKGSGGSGSAYQKMPSMSGFAPSGAGRAGGRRKAPTPSAPAPVAGPTPGGLAAGATDPKVLVPYKPVAGQPPRRVEIERRKRLYAAQDIEKLLLDLGLEYSYGTFRGQRIASQLPLSAFDSTDFEQQTAAEWLAKGMVDGEQQGVPARALRMPDPRQEQGSWVDCLVKGWNNDAAKFVVEWADTGASSDVARIHVLFVAEDPFLFAQRVIVAHTNRAKTESQLRYNLYIDCMPTDDMPTLDSEQLHRVLALALQSQMLQANQNMLDTKSLINEVNLDFSRTMNKIIFDMHSSKGLMPGLNFDLPSEVSDLTATAPATGTVALDLAPDDEGKAVQGDFGSVFGNFAFKTLFTKQEVYNAIEAVAAQCSRLATVVIFKTGIAQPQRLDDFQSLQASHLKESVAFMSDDWASSVKSNIEACLGGIEKGWFKLNETNTEVYVMSKLKKFFTLVNFKMQDTLRFCVRDSLNKYVEMIRAAGGATPKAVGKERGDLKSPLFMLDVVMDDGGAEDGKEAADGADAGAEEGKGDDKKDDKKKGKDDKGEEEEEEEKEPRVKVVYKVMPNEFAGACSNAFVGALAALQNIRQVERRVMSRLFWSHNPTIASVQLGEPDVTELHEELKGMLEDCCEPVVEYLDTFDGHREFLSLDVDQYLADMQDAFKDEDGKLDVLKLVDEVKKKVSEHEKAAEELEKSVPTQHTMNLFQINITTIKTALIDKHKKIRELCLGMLADKNNLGCAEILEAFRKIEKDLSAALPDIEAISDIEEKVKEAPGKVKELGEKSAKVLANFALLDGFHYQLGRADFSAKWTLYGFPGTIAKKCESVTEACAAKREEFLETMKSEQEVFAENLRALDAEVVGLQRFTDAERVDQVSQYVDKLKTKLAKYKEEAALYNSREGLFDADLTEYSLLGETAKKFDPYCNLWETVRDWKANELAWTEEQFLTLDAELIEKRVADFSRKMAKCEKQFTKSNQMGCVKIAKAVQTKVKAFAPIVPLILALRNPGMRERHWSKLAEDTGVPLEHEADDFSLNKILELGLDKHIELANKLGETAGKEFQIEKALKQMKSEWEPLTLVVEEYRDTGTCILKEVDIIMALLDEHVTMTQAMSFSSFKKPFEEEITEWDKSLSTVSEVVDEWLAVQRSWLYLQPIFDSDDIKKQLPTESKRFFTVDKNWRNTMKAAKVGVKAIEFCANEKLYEKFQESNKFLDMVQKGLSDYLETKRASFARFYFLSNDELLEILSETKDPTKVQPHLKKCFEAIKSVTFEPEENRITKIHSREKEVIELTDMVITNGVNVENWMTELENQMRTSVKREFYDAVVDYVESSRTDWMQKWPGQCVINCSQVHWTKETEQALDDNGLDGIKEYVKQMHAQLSDMIVLVQGKLPSLARKSVGALAVIDVHAKDVAEKMVAQGVDNKGEFLWLSQLRYYWRNPGSEMTPWGAFEIPEEGDPSEGFCEIIMVTSKRPYCNEYLGNSFRLVITPLTDKCYLTLMGALEMILGGAPAGPAGTGKTETTKDLAKALAQQCVVFNCSDGMDYKMTGKFFKGLASCGAMCCFDEFNRILIEVLSVIAQQIMTLQKAVVNREPRCIFEETDIRVNPCFSVFITMNPGYAGRTELPDNLAALFRPVAMMVPDYGLIGEIMLIAFGYLNARKLARKMVATFRLCSEQLSSQDHYDYGMRAVKTVIVAAGNLKRGFPEEDEELLMLRGLFDVNLPKFLSHDLPLFFGIMSDLFPGKTKPSIDYGALTRAIKLECQAKNLMTVPWFMEKVIQLYEMIVVRHGLMVVGPTGGGKSSNIQVLQDALTRLAKNGIKGERYEKVHLEYINPKSITMGQLYGSFDPNTHEWQDGILANLIRVCAKDTKPDLKWMHFDGPVDTLWIESMNTVLDDNKKLCLNSGEIVALSAQMTMMFEPADLSVASPATVSRCGMIYMEPKSLGLDGPTHSWFNTLPKVFPKAMKTKFKEMMDKYLFLSLSFLRRNLKETVPTVDNNLAFSLRKLIDCWLVPFHITEGDDKPSEDEVKQFNKIAEAIFMFGFVWTVAATVDGAGRKRFDAYLRQHMLANDFAFPFPNKGLIYDYALDFKTGKWVDWMSLAPPYVHDPKRGFAEMIVSTMDTTRYTYFLDILVKNGKHVLCCGDTGTGKTVNVSTHLSTGMEKKFIPLMFTFSAQTSANQTQDIIDGKCEKRRKGVFGPMAGKTYIIFVDDVNMPQREIFGAQPPIELLRQWLCASGWYDRKTLKWRKIIDSILVLACGPPGGGRNPVTPRFFRHFNVIAYSAMDDSVMFTIFQTILMNFLASFESDCQRICDAMVTSTIAIYNTIKLDLLPTPAKSHYTFNLRDLGKVFQGVLMGSAKKITTAVDLARIWVHEARCVFADRLINDSDRAWFENQLETKVTEDFKLKWKEVVPNDLLICCDYMIPGAEPRVYEAVADNSTILPIVEEYLGDYNAESKQPMYLVLFIDAIKHVSRISRVIRQPQGNALLLGVGGSGRQSLTRLATFMAEYELFQIAVAKGYGQTEWREDLRACLLKAGVEEKPTVFLFVDTQIVFEGMLEDVNNILNSGDVPNLYGPEEMDAIMTSCRIECQRKRIPPTKINIFAQYILRVRRNIHVVLAMSPLGDDFRRRLRMFPSLVNCCTIDWFSEWPDEALKSVGTSAMTETDLKLGATQDQIVEFFKVIHQSVFKRSKRFLDELGRHNYVTPTSFLELLDTYKNTLVKKRIEIGDLRDKLQNGLDKIRFTQGEVADLSIKLEKMQPELVKTQAEVDAMIIQIQKDTVQANEAKAIVEQTEADATIQAAEAKAIADDAQRDLDEALPALDEAVACLNLLKKGDIDEVRAMKSPPEGVKLVTEVCCIFFGVKPVMEKDPNKMGAKIKNYWPAGKAKLFGNPKAFLEMLFNFDKDNIPEKVIRSVVKYMDDPNFEPKAISKASKACTAICMWARAMYKYDTVAKEVEPKKALLAKAQGSLDATMQILKEAKEKLDGVNSRLAELEAGYNKSLAKKDALAAQVKQCSDRLERADILIGGLAGEQARWAETVKTLGQAYINLKGDVLVSSGTIAYLGPFTPEYRQAIVSEWTVKLKELGVEHTEGCSIESVLADPVQVRGWMVVGLPSDSHSVQNGIIMDTARRWPLLIDPQGQANRFIRNLGKEQATNGLDVIKLTDPNFLRTLENGVRFGKWVLLENINEELDAALEPLLLQQKFKQGGTLMIKIGDSTIPYNDQFRFMMTTKLPNPHYPPEVCVKVSLLNFTITPGGLEDQLLGVVIKLERPELEQQKSALVVSNARMAKELKNIEDQILRLLKESKGNILDDVELIETLGQSKKTSEAIKEKVKEAAITEKEIDETREKYRPVAFRGSLLYFSIADLAMIDPMYEYSMQWFTMLFSKGVEDAEPDEDLEKRKLNLINYFTYSLYEQICRSLFERHKLLFSFVMTIKILMGDNLVNMEEWMFLLSGVHSSKSEAENPDPSWIIGRAWTEICFLDAISTMTGLANDPKEGFKAHLKSWRAYFDDLAPQEMELPGKWKDINSFQRMCVLRTLRPDKAMDAMMNFVIEKIGQKFVEPPPFDLGACYEASSVTSPLVFVLTSGSDPTKMFYNFANEMRMGNKVAGLSLGQGQDVIAERMIEQGQLKGTWVYLQNCHLYVSWMTKLAQICEECDPEQVHKDYRLWLTSMPSKAFPVAILQNGVKMTLEPPKGLKANMKNAYFKLDDDKINITNKPFEYKKLLFALCFFHASVQDRRKYGPLGWNIPYAFNDTDLEISKAQLENFLNRYPTVPYTVLNKMTSYINYGGRVTDYIDLRTIDVLLRDLFRPEIMTDDFKFSRSGVYYSIPVNDDSPHAAYVEYIDSLPLNSNPEAFGMHENAAIICAETETTETFNTILSLQAKASSSTGLSPEEILDAKAAEIMADVADQYDIESVSMVYPLTYSESMNTVLVQELMRYNKLIHAIRSTLPVMRKALKGLVVMSVELEGMSKSLTVQKIPEMWQAHAYPSLKPLGPWVVELKQRITFLQDWIDKGIPAVFWIPGFFFPQAFMTGTLQNFARKYTLPIDTISFDFEWKKEDREELTRPEDGCYIDGLYLEGARFDMEKGHLADSFPKQLYTLAPVFHLQPVQNREQPKGGIYRTPVYKTLRRAGTLSTTGHSTNFVLWMELPGGRDDFVNNLGMADQDYWIKAGVAMFCSLRY